MAVNVSTPYGNIYTQMYVPVSYIHIQNIYPLLPFCRARINVEASSVFDYVLRSCQQYKKKVFYENKKRKKQNAGIIHRSRGREKKYTRVRDIWCVRV